MSLRFFGRDEKSKIELSSRSERWGREPQRARFAQCASVVAALSFVAHYSLLCCSILANIFNENKVDLKSNLCFGYLQCFNRRHILEGVSIEAKKDVETHVTLNKSKKNKSIQLVNLDSVDALTLRLGQV